MPHTCTPQGKAVPQKCRWRLWRKDPQTYTSHAHTRSSVLVVVPFLCNQDNPRKAPYMHEDFNLPVELSRSFRSTSSTSSGAALHLVGASLRSRVTGAFVPRRWAPSTALPSQRGAGIRGIGGPPMRNRSCAVSGTSLCSGGFGAILFGFGVRTGHTRYS